MENKVCEFCNKEVEENFNFCPYCGEALTDIAKQINAKVKTNAKLELVFKLLENTNDEKTIELLQNFVEQAKKNV